MTNRMQLENMEEQNDERYLCYRPVEAFRIFHAEVDKEDVEMHGIFIAVGLDLQEMQSVVSEYLEWLDNCEKELTDYIQIQLGEPLPCNWLADIEICGTSIVFNSADDYGATISFGAESVFGGHIVELEFDKREIVANGLIG